MQFATITSFVAAVLAAAAGTNAAVIQRDGARLAQFRVFGATGCSELNQGFFTVDQSDAGRCNSLTELTPPPGVVSLMLEDWTSPAALCSLSIFADDTCSTGQKVLTLGVCENAGLESPAWGSWRIDCL